MLNCIVRGVAAVVWPDVSVASTEMRYRPLGIVLFVTQLYENGQVLEVQGTIVVAGWPPFHSVAGWAVMEMVTLST